MSNKDIEAYYKNKFPFHELLKWLTTCDDPESELNLSHREFSYSMTLINGDEIYRRWNSFDSWEELKRNILNCNPIPHKFDIGAVYNYQVAWKDMLMAGLPGAFRPVSREFVIDIDMNDYDEVRSCCEGKKVCMKCWKFISVAIEILTKALREDFGAKKILWIFSGRRGAHCWIADDAFRELATDERSAIVEYLRIVPTKRMGQNRNAYWESLIRKWAHPHARRSGEILESHFEDIFRDQDTIIKKSDYQEKLIKFISSVVENQTVDSLTGLIERALAAVNKGSANNFDFTSSESMNASLLIWRQIDKIFESNLNNTHARNAMKNEIMADVLYPRLDVNVSKDCGHLLKAPFCVHVATGMLCLPLIPDEDLMFDPVKDSCNVTQLLANESAAVECFEKRLDFFKKYINSR